RGQPDSWQCVESPRTTRARKQPEWTASNPSPPKQRLDMVERLHPKHWKRIKPQPVRRVYIPKPGKAEKRPLGIPVMETRGHQALVKLALEPEWEAKFEANSYGFRPGRCCQDAIAAI